MPVRDETKRMEFLRSLSVEDLANRRITEYSSEAERRMIHDARELMAKKNDERYLQRQKEKAKIDMQKAAMNDVRRRGGNEIFGREGGLTGGAVGQVLLPALGVTGLGIGGVAAARRGNFRVIGQAINPSQIQQATGAVQGATKNWWTINKSAKLKGLSDRAKDGYRISDKKDKEFFETLKLQIKHNQNILSKKEQKWFRRILENEKQQKKKTLLQPKSSNNVPDVPPPAAVNNTASPSAAVTSQRVSLGNPATDSQTIANFKKRLSVNNLSDIDFDTKGTPQKIANSIKEFAENSTHNPDDVIGLLMSQLKNALARWQKNTPDTDAEDIRRYYESIMAMIQSSAKKSNSKAYT